MIAKLKAWAWVAASAHATGANIEHSLGYFDVDEFGRLVGVGGEGSNFTSRSANLFTPSSLSRLTAEAQMLISSKFWRTMPEDIPDSTQWLSGSLLKHLDEPDVDFHDLTIVERAALEVLELHTRDLPGFDPESSGCEWCRFNAW